jgi:hypothetical protein
MSRIHDVRSIDFELCHPKARDAFKALNGDLAAAYEAGTTQTKFQVFECYRSPIRQDYLFGGGSTKARGWQSAHQYGLAVDFVPFVPLAAGGAIGQWSWAAHHDYSYLTAAARKRGLDTPISWDFCHVEHPLWAKIRSLVI